MMTKRGKRRLAMLATAAVVGVAALATAFAVRGSLNAKKIADAREQGLTLYEAKEFETALPHLGTVVAKVKDDPEVLVAFADCRWRVPMPNNAHIGQSIATAKAAAGLEPDNIATQQLLLDLYAETGYLTELIDLAERVLASDPSLHKPRSQLIQALMLLRRTVEALAQAEMMIEHHPDRLGSHKGRATVARRYGDTIDEVVTRAKAQEPLFAGNPEYFAWVAELQIEAGATHDAIVSARAAATLEPVSASQISDLVDLLRELDDEVNNAGLEPVDADAPRPLLMLADELFNRAIGDPAMGRAVAAEATRRAWWLNQTARAMEYALRVGTPDDAEKGLPLWWAAVALLSEPADAPARLGTGFDTDSYVDSIAETEWGQILTALAALRRGENERVVRVLGGFEPIDAETRAVASYVRGKAMHRMGDTRGAILELRNAAETPGIKRDRAWKALGDAYTVAGDFQRAGMAYRDMSNRGSMKSLDRLDDVLRLAEREGDTPLAREALDRILSLADSAPHDEPTYQVRLARAMILAGEADRGIRLAEDLIGRDPPPDPLGTLQLIRTLRVYAPTLGEDLLASIAEQTDSIEVLASQANALALAGKLDEGRALLQAKIDEHDEDGALPYRRALLRILDGFQTDDATSEASRFSDDYPGSATAQLAVLSGRAIWLDREAARLAVTRLKEAVGEHSTVWQTFEARATLESDPTVEEIIAVVTSLGEVTEKDPDDFDALVLTARAYEQLAELQSNDAPEDDAGENTDRASAYYERAEGNGIRAAAYKPHIELLRSAGRIAESQRILDRFVALEFLPFSKPENLYVGQLIERRDLLVASGRWSEAAQDQVWLAEFDDPQSVLYLAQLHERAGENAEAADIIEQFLERRAWDADLTEAAAVILADCGYTDRAIEVYRTLPASGIETEQKIANMLMRVGRPAEAVPLQLRLARETDRVADWITTIRAVTATGDQDAIDAIVGEARAAHPDSPEIEVFSEGSVLRRISLALSSSIPESAEPGLAALRTLTARHGRGEIDDAAMLGELRSFTGANPDVYEGWRHRVQALVIAGQPQQALDAAREAADAMPESPEAIRQYTDALRNMGRLDDAVPVAERLVHLMRHDAFEAQQILAVIEADRREYQRVIDLLTTYRDRLVLASQDGPRPGLSALAVGFAGIGNPAEAESLFLARARADGVAWQRVALIAASALPDEDRVTRRKWLALATDPSLEGPRANGLLRLARYSGDPADALAAMAIFERSGDASNPDWLWIAARAAKFSGDSARAERFHRDLIAIAPDEPAVVASLADLLARQPDRTDEALSLLDQATSGGSGDALSDENRELFLIARARAHLNAGRPETAVGLLDPIGANGDPAPARLSLLAKACLDLGNPERATKLVDQAASMTPLEASTAAEIRAIRNGLTP